MKTLRQVGHGDIIRKTFYEGGIDELVSTRRLEHIVKAMPCSLIDSRNSVMGQ